MAIYHLHAGFVSRSSGRTSVQSAAYICGEKLHEDHRDKDADYRDKKKEVAITKTLAPERSKYKDISVWNAIENFEDRYAESHFKSEKTRDDYKSSVQTAQTMVLALPNELSVKACEDLLDKFVDTRFTSRNLITTYAVHSKEGNLHAHVQVSRRAIGENGEFVTRKDREICTKSSLLETRKLWADLLNEHLVREGFKERVTEKSFADLGIDLEATRHRGWYADTIGTDSRIARENVEISRQNEEKILSDPNIILDSLNEKKAVFTQKDILNEISKRVFEEKNISIVFEKVLEEAKYVGEGINGEFLYTGEKYQQLESDVLSKFDVLAQKSAEKFCETNTIESVLKKYDYLNEEQKSAVYEICGERNFDILVGKAGAGKTTTMQAISEVYTENGSRVIGMSLSAVASENLGKDADIESATIASWAHRWRTYEAAKEEFLSFNSIVTEGVLKQIDWYNDLQRYERYQLKSGDVIVVDEAGMVGTKEWKVVLDAAEKFGAKVIAVGDDNQFNPIGAGHCFKQFLNFASADNCRTSDRTPVTVCRLNLLRRQKVDWQREASVEFSNLNTGEALARYENHGMVHEVEESMYQQVSRKYLEIEKLGTAVVLCSTNRECSAINDEVRALKKERGELGKTICSIQTMVNNRLSCKDFSENDRIIFLKNDKRLDVKNGQVGNVKSFNAGILSVETESGVKKIDVREYKSADHAYAITLHKSQGKTYDNTIVLANKIMDAKAFYVAMTRHRESVDLYYSKSDFGSFKDLVNCASKVINKDSLEDFRAIENQNKSRVFEYKETLLEIASVLRDINRGEAEWKEYHALKSSSTMLGKEILENYSSHKLYLDQQGITREKLEISIGLKQRPLSNVELNAKNTVALYAQAAAATREEYAALAKSSFNITKHENYKKYCEIRELRNDLAKEILSNYPLHREFVNQISKEFFISRKSMENQVDYAERMAGAKPFGISQASKRTIETVSETEIFAKLEAAKNEERKTVLYEECSLSDCVMLDKRASDYKECIETHTQRYGYAPHVSRSMLVAYCGENDLKISMVGDYVTNEYASMIAHNKMESNGIREFSVEIAEEAIKQALCFKALKESDGIKELTPENVKELHNKAGIISGHLTKENMHVLDDKKFMQLAYKNVNGDGTRQSLSDVGIQHLVKQDHNDISRQTEQSKGAEMSIEASKSRGFEVSI
jgi:nucleoside-triphosphatase THEP1